MTSKKTIYLIILISTLIRVIVACSMSLGNDEVYYLSYAHHLQWNYFDHPPLVTLLIKLTTFNLYFTSEFFIRLGPIILAGVNTFFIYKIGKKIKGERAGILAALLFTSSLYSSIIAGIFILPDTPQLFFWILSIYCVLQIVVVHQAKSVVNRNLVYFGILVGCCIMSKVHAVFLWFGFGAYILLFERQLFCNPYLYVSLLLTVFIASPIILWNIDNDFITYKFHSDRVVVKNGINFSSFIREVVGGAFYNNPINSTIIAVGITAFFKKKITIDVSFQRILILMGLPLIVVLLAVSLFRDTLPHWSGPGYVSLIILVSCYLSDVKKDSVILNWVYYANYFIVLICFLGVLVINYFPGTMGDKQASSLGKRDVTLDMYDWDFFKNEFSKLRNQDILQKGYSSTFIVNNKWFPGAHVDNYIAQPLHLDYVGLGKLEDIHNYFWLNKTRRPLQRGDNAYFITFSNCYSDPKVLYRQYFKKINNPRVVVQTRGGYPARKMFVYFLENYQGNFIIQ
ncbi:ArnT family glycosyltransferase [Flavobacterium faecale]|nr:glycosyltransferase family 39 protein [Flavobacterium faecale]